ncbi:SPASM domain-containing protein [Vibrio harveyi]|uniref:SPASM domain-containing protein n=1 Tax=Vibrio harveyi TaxID=669 RepID=UPI003CF45B84
MSKKIDVKISKLGNVTMLRSPEYNYNYNMESGHFARWGKELSDDPSYAPMPEILDIEITTSCAGPANKLCGFCYKSNNPNGYNMPFEHFKTIIDKMPWLTQCALGADAQGTSNPDMFKMMEYARTKGIIPNLTIADVSKEVAQKLSSVAGAVAVSVYKHAGFDVAFDSVQNLSDAGVSQINLHYMISGKTIQDAYRVVDMVMEDPRLSSVNAIVFLSLKQKGRGAKYDYVSQEEYANLVKYCHEKKVSFGFDSCSAPAYVDSIKHLSNAKQLIMYSEDCESTLFSSYINEKGEFYPCSFTEKWVEGGWESGLDVLAAEDFIKDIWNHPKTLEFRKALIANVDDNGCRNCPAFAVCGRDMRLSKNNIIFKQPA